MTSVRTFSSSVLDGHERGLEFGAAHAAQVAANLAAYDELFALRGAEFGVDAARVREISDEVGRATLERVDEFAPALGREIVGIAEGAGCATAAVAAINARTEVFAAIQQSGAPLAPNVRPRSECSTVIALGREGAEPVAMQNWDWYISLAAGWLVWEIPHPDGGVTQTATEYGIVGKIGLGRHGLGVLFNILGHERDGRGAPGVPVHVISRHVMDTAATVDEGIALARSATASASTVLTLVTAAAPENSVGGATAAACAEIWPGGVDVIRPQDGLLYHTNHFLGDGPRAGDVHLTSMPDTVERLAALHRQLDPVGGGADAEQVRAALCDHGDGPNSLCCHPDPADPEGARFATLLTASLHCAAGRLDVTAGEPCQHRRELALAEL